MSSFSAPRWTEDDERRERMNLTAEERERVYSDLFGYRFVQRSNSNKNGNGVDSSTGSTTSSSTGTNTTTTSIISSNSGHRRRRRSRPLPRRSNNNSSTFGGQDNTNGSSIHSGRTSTTSASFSSNHTFADTTSATTIPADRQHNSFSVSSSTIVDEAEKSETLERSFMDEVVVLLDETTVTSSAASISTDDMLSAVVGGKTIISDDSDDGDSIRAAATTTTTEAISLNGGSTSAVVVDKAIQTTAMLEMVEAIESMTVVSHSRKKCKYHNTAYMEAMRYNPKLINHDIETNLHAFLRRENGMPVPAAERVCSYWNFRKEIFVNPSRPGNDHGLEPNVDNSDYFCGPVTLTKDGIMSEEDVRLLQSGVLKFLPNDQQGRIVLFFDKAAFRNPKEYSRMCFVRCMFYMLHRAMTIHNVNSNDKENVGSVPDVVLVCNFANYDASHFDRKCVKAQMEMLSKCLPIRIVAMHYCYGSQKSAFDLVLPTIKSLMGSNLRQRLCLHIGTPTMIAESLEEYGIVQVPPVLGGDFVPMTPTEWIEQCKKEDLHKMIEGTSSISNAINQSSNVQTLSTQQGGSTESVHKGIPTTTTISSTTQDPHKIKSSKLKSTWNRAA